MEQKNQGDLYIPAYVTAKHEYFPGFGKRNYILPFSCQHLSFFSIIIYGIVRDLSIPILTVLIGIPACAGFNTRIEGNISMRLFIMLLLLI